MTYLAILLTGLLVSSNVAGFTGIRRSGNDVYYVSRNSPAFFAGVHKNDHILTIDGSTDGELRGPAGTYVELKVEREHQEYVFIMKRVPHNEAYE